MPLAIRAVHLGARVLHPLTVGIRAAILDERGHVFLVKHSYVPGWHLPGGGVEPGETAREALTRELLEEANIQVREAPVLHGMFFNRGMSRRDHVLVYVVRNFTVLGPREPDWEIVETGFFDPKNLPGDTARASATRLREILGGSEPSEDW